MRRIAALSSEIEFTGVNQCAGDRRWLTAVDVPEAFAVVVHAEHTVLGIVSLAASGAGKEAANVRPLPVEVFRDGEGRAATARDQKHAREHFAIVTRFGRGRVN